MLSFVFDLLLKTLLLLCPNLLCITIVTMSQFAL
jgi:hypothetical protein